MWYHRVVKAGQVQLIIAIYLETIFEQDLNKMALYSQSCPTVASNYWYWGKRTATRLHRTPVCERINVAQNRGLQNRSPRYNHGMLLIPD